MEILKIVETLQEPSFEVVSNKMGAPFAEAINEAVSLLVAQGERITDLEDKLAAVGASGLTPDEVRFFKSPVMVDICRRIRAAAERGAL